MEDDTPDQVLAYCLDIFAAEEPDETMGDGHDGNNNNDANLQIAVRPTMTVVPHPQFEPTFDTLSDFFDGIFNVFISRSLFESDPALRSLKDGVLLQDALTDYASNYVASQPLNTSQKHQYVRSKLVLLYFLYLVLRQSAVSLGLSDIGQLFRGIDTSLKELKNERIVLERMRMETMNNNDKKMNDDMDCEDDTKFEES